MSTLGRALSYVFLTDRQGTLLVPEAREHEPEPGSIVLTGGLYGTCWQRHFDDGLWYSTGRRESPKTWPWLVTRRNLVLVYVASTRKTSREERV